MLKLMNPRQSWRRSYRPACRAMIVGLATCLTAALASPSAHAKDLPAFEEVIEGLIEVTPPTGEGGLMQLWRTDASDPTSDPTKLICRIPRGLLEQDLLFASTITAGPFAGYQWTDALVRWRLVGNRVILEAPDTRYVADGKSSVDALILRTYQPVIVAALPIITMAGADPVVDLGGLITRNPAGAPVPGPIAAPLVQLTDAKIFPENILLELNLPYSVGDGQYESVGVAYAFRKLPALGSYSPRVADERIGYFLTARQDWGASHTERDNMIRYVNRWNLKKQDPELALSPPVEPIVFIIEDTVPVRWRRWVRAGLEEWNRAYEAIGFSGAVVVYQQTASNEFANIDPADARYNFIRWIVSGRPFAMGPSRVDPRTGQILDADIIVDDSFLRYMIDDVDLFSPAAMAGDLGPGMIEFYENNPAFLPFNAELPPADERQQLLMDAAAEARIGRLDSGAGLSQCAVCTHARGLQHQMSVTHAAMLSTHSGKDVPEEVVGVMIKDLIMHEVGHTLGLRHNFKASAWLTTEEIQARRGTGEALTASVMDYNANAFFVGDNFDEGILAFSNPTIGPYDIWAIEYGYKMPGADDGGEDTMLAAIAARSAEPGLAFATDEDTMGLSSPDPLVNRWDLAADPVVWAQSRIALADELLATLTDWTASEDAGNEELRRIYGTLMWERNRAMNYVSRVISGQYFSRSRPTDEGATTPFTLVDPADQRAALAFLGETTFNDAFWDLDPNLLNRLPASRWSDWNGRASARIDFAVHDMILNQQTYALSNLMSPPAIQRVYDAELKSDGEDRFTAAELIQTATALVWDLEIEDAKFTDAQPMLPSTRRNLQQQHLRLATSYLAPGSGGISPDLAAMFRYSLRTLAADIETMLEARGDKIDFASRAHLSESADLINRSLAGVFVDG